jgi:Icc-related predicted phosphoesterase
MKLLCIADLHGDHSALDRVLEDAGAVDMVLFGGDITNFGTPNAAEGLVRRAQQACSTVLAVAGNCDSAAIDQRLMELGVSLFGRGVMHSEFGLYGVSAMPPWQGTMYELTEEQIAAALETGRQQLRAPDREIVLSHPPPWNTDLDRTSRGDHVGSEAVRTFIEQNRPSLVVCGHIHESRGIERIGPTHIVNCGPAFRGHYALAEITQDVRIELRTAE